MRMEFHLWEEHISQNSQHGLPSFKEVLQKVSAAYQDQREKIIKQRFNNKKFRFKKFCFKSRS